MNEEKENKKKLAKWKKVLIITISCFMAFVLIAICTLYGIFFNEVNAFFSIKKIDANIYSMTYNNDYYFDEFLQTGASSDSEIAEFVQKKLLHGFNFNLSSAETGCSSFVATTNSGEHLFARNLDVDYNPIMVLKTKPKNGYASISLVDLYNLGFTYKNFPKNILDKFFLLASPYIPMDGMNEKGVSICINMVNGERIQQNTEKIDITETTLIRLVLDKASNVDEAISLIKKYDLHDNNGGPYHYLIADKTGKSVAVEYFNNEIQVIDNSKVLTNHTLNTLETSTSTFYNTNERFTTISEKLNETGGILSVQESINLLQNVKMDWNEYVSGSDGGTLYSAVYNLDKLELQFVHKGMLEKVYKFEI